MKIPFTHVHIRIDRKFQCRWDDGYCIVFGFEWGKYVDYQRIHCRHFHITLFGMDVWFEGRKYSDALMRSLTPGYLISKSGTVIEKKYAGLI